MQSDEWKRNWKYPVIEHDKLTPWNWMVSHPYNFVMGKYVDIGAFTFIDAAYGVILEDDVQIGSHCAIYSHNTIDDEIGEVLIREGACVGSHTTILPGVHIGKNSIVGAHSLVKFEIPEGTTWAGVPAKLIRGRINCESCLKQIDDREAQKSLSLYNRFLCLHCLEMRAQADLDQVKPRPD